VLATPLLTLASLDEEMGLGTDRSLIDNNIEAWGWLYGKEVYHAGVVMEHEIARRSSHHYTAWVTRFVRLAFDVPTVMELEDDQKLVSYNRFFRCHIEKRVSGQVATEL